jgi:hypothetical protein
MNIPCVKRPLFPGIITHFKLLAEKTSHHYAPQYGDKGDRKALKE